MAVQRRQPGTGTGTGSNLPGATVMPATTRTQVGRGWRPDMGALTQATGEPTTDPVYGTIPQADYSYGANTPSGPPDRTTGQGIDESPRYDGDGYTPNPNTSKNQSGGAQVGNGSPQWGSKDPDYIKSQVDRIFGLHGRTARQDEYDQWIRYVTKDDINGAGQTISGWDPYWESRLNMHATGDYYGDGTTPVDENSKRAQPGYTPGGGTGGGTGQPPMGYAGPATGDGGPRGGGGGVDPRGNPTDVMSQLQALMGNGGKFNQDLVNARTESAREGLERRRVGELEGDRAVLADRGLLGSGAEISSLSRLGNELGSEYAGTIRDIYSDEAGRADERYVQALSLATGMSIEDAKRAVEMAQINSSDRNADADRSLQASLGFGRLDLDRALGFGGLDLERLNTMNQYNLGQGRLNLDRDLGGINAGNVDDDEMLRMLQMLLQHGGNLGGGYNGA